MHNVFLYIYFILDEREVQTEGKLLLIGTESGSIQGYGLHSRQKVNSTHLPNCQ